MKHLLPPIQLRFKHEDIHDGHLILVNSDYPVKLRKREPSLEKTCLRQLKELLKACDANDRIALVSGYRSYMKQQQIYETSLKENGVAFTNSYVARPGESEHQTGLAVDVGENGDHVDFICPSFPDRGVYSVFKQLAPEYGFIQRYKEGKESITRIACEPWHFRYVGFPHSVIMEQKGLCLEEYSGYIKRFKLRNPYLFIESKSSFIEIYYVPANEGVTIVPIRNADHYHVSGNNRDGFIVTVFHSRGSDTSGN